MIHYNLPHSHGQAIQTVLNNMPSVDDFEKVSLIFQLISDPTRLKILWILCHCEECVSDIAAAMEMSNPAVSHHLKLLRQSGIVESRREGKEIYYTLAKNDKGNLLHQAIDSMFEITCPCKK